jgi:hypothetical protein
MKIFVVFDEKGQIRGTVLSMYDQMKIRSPEGTSVHTIEKPEIGPGHKDAQHYVRDLHENFRVEVLGEPRLVRKKG